MAELKSLSLINDANLIAYYRLESGALTTDSKGGHTLTKAGTVNNVTGKYGSCASATWNNSNYLYGAVFGSNLGTGAISMGCWFKKSSVPTNNYSPTILTIGNNYRIYILAQKNTGYVGFHSWDGSYTTITSTVNVCDDKWHFIVGTRSGTSIKCYVDGVLVASNTGTARSVDSRYLYIGTIVLTDDNILNALIDDIFVFNRALTANEVLTIFKSRSGGALLYDLL